MRQWPPEQFAELINLLLERQHLNVALIGGVDEKALADHVLNHVENSSLVINLVGRLPLAELATLLASAALFIGNNSGPQHIAASLGVPTVGIHSGVVDAREWGPMGPNAVAVRRQMSCSPCYIEQPTDCPRQLACLRDLSVAHVLNACDRVLVRNHSSAISKAGISSAAVLSV
jgi:ADP-heptose:LPS heptosyltransferase